MHCSYNTFFVLLTLLNHPWIMLLQSHETENLLFDVIELFSAQGKEEHYV